VATTGPVNSINPQFLLGHLPQRRNVAFCLPASENLPKDTGFRGEPNPEKIRRQRRYTPDWLQKQGPLPASHRFIPGSNLEMRQPNLPILGPLKLAV